MGTASNDPRETVAICAVKSVGGVARQVVMGVGTQLSEQSERARGN